MPEEEIEAFARQSFGLFNICEIKHRCQDIDTRVYKQIAGTVFDDIFIVDEPEVCQSDIECKDSKTNYRQTVR